MKDSLILKNLKIDYDKLQKYGFSKIDNYYEYKVQIINKQFELVIIIEENNSINSKVIEIENNEEFLLYNVESSTGSFVGQMREKYNNIIDDIKEKCCLINVFKSGYANLIIKYIKEKYNDEFEYLWAKFPENAIARNKTNNKWYSALLIIDKTKIGIEEEGKIEIIDLLLQPEKIDELVDNKKYFAGYHMNKKHWITIKLDGTVEIKEIYKLIDNSYELSLRK